MSYHVLLLLSVTVIECNNNFLFFTANPRRNKRSAIVEKNCLVAEYRVIWDRGQVYIMLTNGNNNGSLAMSMGRA